MASGSGGSSSSKESVAVLERERERERSRDGDDHGVRRPRLTFFVGARRSNAFLCPTVRRRAGARRQKSRQLVRQRKGLCWNGKLHFVSVLWASLSCRDSNVRPFPGQKLDRELRSESTSRVEALQAVYPERYHGCHRGSQAR